MTFIELKKRIAGLNSRNIAFANLLFSEIPEKALEINSRQAVADFIACQLRWNALHNEISGISTEFLTGIVANHYNSLGRRIDSMRDKLLIHPSARKRMELMEKSLKKEETPVSSGNVVKGLIPHVQSAA